MTREAHYFARRAATLLAAVVLAVAGCVGLAPEAHDLETRKFQPLLDKGVIYLVRGEPFVMQQLSYRHDISYFTMIEELDGRAAVRRASLLKGY